MNKFDLGILENLTSQDQHLYLIEYLTCPYSSPWGQLDEPSFENAFLRLREELSEEPYLPQLLELYLIAHLLKDGEKAPSWATAFMQRHISLNRHFPSISWDSLMGGSWTVFPVAMVMGDRKQVLHFMAGLLAGVQGRELLPPWAQQLLDNGIRQALLDAAAEASARHPMPADASLCVFPMALPNAICRFDGASLGLPAALAFMKLLSGKKTSERYLATGVVLEKGHIHSVDGLANKRLLALEENRFSLFIYPEENGDIPGETELDVFPVSNLDEAWGAVRRHAPGNGGELLMFGRMMKDPEAFVAGMERVDATWVSYEAKNGRCRNIVEKIIDQPAHFAGYVARIDRMLAARALDAAETYLDLCTLEDLAAAARRAPLSVFKFYIQRIALANHRGDVASAQASAGRAETLLQIALKGDLNLCADFFNIRFVTRHNRYCFDPVLPGDLARVLEILERRHTAQCQGGCPTDPSLARLYGTIAQNFGFCGPDFLREARTYANKAMAAFGDGVVPEFGEDRLRQRCYLFYAFLDAGDSPRAEQSLEAFINTDDEQHFTDLCRADRLNTWHHAALARFFADTGDTAKSRKYLRWCTDHKEALRGGHPCQLWAFNVGRIAFGMAAEDAVTWFQQSLDLCLEKERNPTIRAMALLPLSGLWRLGVLDESRTPALLSGVIRSALELNETHFRPLMESNRDLLLENIWKRPQALFPFTYR